MRSLIFALTLTLAACSSTVDTEEHAGVVGQHLDDDGDAGGAPASCDPPVDCNHAVDASAWCLSCVDEQGSCAEGDIVARGALGGDCAPFLAPGGTALDASCIEGLWCSRCSGTCSELPRDCDC